MGENNLYNVGLTHLVHPQVGKIELKAKYVSNKQAFLKYFLRQSLNVNK